MVPQNLPLPIVTHQQHQQPVEPNINNQSSAAQSRPAFSLPESHIPKSASHEETFAPPEIGAHGITPSSGSVAAGARGTLQAQEESTMMKKDMCSQMVFQNKIRALKQIELSKYGGNGDYCSTDDADTTAYSNTNKNDGHNHSSSSSQHEEQPEPVTIEAPTSPSQNQLSEAFDQGLFWNSEDDDQVFDFLMEH